jgi:hypothetical protein
MTICDKQRTDIAHSLFYLIEKEIDLLGNRYLTVILSFNDLPERQWQGEEFTDKSC